MRIQNMIVAAVLLLSGLNKVVLAADVSVTVIELEAKGVDGTIAAAVSDDLAFYIEKEKIPVISNDSLKAELKRRGFSQTCGVDDCPVAFDQILKSTHMLRGSVSQLGGKRILKVVLEKVAPREPVFSGRREFDQSDEATLAAVRQLAAQVVECLQGKNCEDEVTEPSPVRAITPNTTTTTTTVTEVTPEAVKPHMKAVKAQQEAMIAASNAMQSTSAASATVNSFIPASPPDAQGMITIPAGNFLYGKDKKSIYLPVFKIDRTEVTAGEYEKCVQSGDCDTPGGWLACNWSWSWTFFGKGSLDSNFRGHPANCVSWDDAKAYCEWVGKRLPTDQEWEKAARGTDGRNFPWGDQAPSCERAVMFNGSVSCGKGNTTWPVCSKPSGNSPYGLCDMAGNVLEWTSGTTDENANRNRGGSWRSRPEYLRSAASIEGVSYLRFADLGFRCAADAK